MDRDSDDTAAHNGCVSKDTFKQNALGLIRTGAAKTSADKRKIDQPKDSIQSKSTELKVCVPQAKIHQFRL